ncbi:E3 ubiquitin-protein ligase ATL4-like [Cocos nucifera]|nr:E3 ubiquitin-protein ligase ATL4-like [Cocos nucifera]
MLSLLASSSPLSPLLPPAIETLPSSDSNHHHPSSTSFLIIVAILVFVFVASAAIHLLLHFLSRSSSSSSSSSSLAPSDQDCSGLIDSLPPFSLAAGTLESSPDCAVCLSRLLPDDDLRLLPACHHAFHSPCIAAWLCSNPSCPLCRSPILLPPPPPPPLQPPSATSATVIRRDDHPAPAPPLPARPSSLGPSVDQLEAAKMAEAAEPASGVARGWLKEYVDRLALSASSSFSPMGSRRFGGGGDSWDLEGDVGTSGGGGRSASYRWSMGAFS